MRRGATASTLDLFLTNISFITHTRVAGLSDRDVALIDTNIRPTTQNNYPGIFIYAAEPV